MGHGDGHRDLHGIGFSMGLTLDTGLLLEKEADDKKANKISKGAP